MGDELLVEFIGLAIDVDMHIPHAGDHVLALGIDDSRIGWELRLACRTDEMHAIARDDDGLLRDEFAGYDVDYRNAGEG